MNKKEGILRPFKNIHGGAHLPHNNNTAKIATEMSTPPETVVIPMQQHIGAPCNALVNAGDKVYIGTKIGESDAFVSAPIHSSVSGIVKEVTKITLNNGTEFFDHV